MVELGLGVSITFLIANSNPEIASLTKLGGYVRWTGAGGQIEDLLKQGRSLTGGTLETLAPDAWATLVFKDGTAVTILGQSELTISADRQKVLHLPQGYLAAQVTRQPPGNPMLIHTNAAELEVLGTQFNVTADSSQTKLIVNYSHIWFLNPGRRRGIRSLVLDEVAFRGQGRIRPHITVGRVPIPYHLAMGSATRQLGLPDWRPECGIGDHQCRVVSV